ncbi:MAG: hypothetical protein R3E57_00510 [Porticoccaceae bacterium]
MDEQTIADPSGHWQRIFPGWWPGSVNAIGLGCALLYALLAWYSWHPQQLTPWSFFGLLGCAFALSLIACLRAKQLSAVQVLVWAAVFRLIGCLGQPLLEDDFFRYLWDGYRFAVDGSPYAVPPAVFFGDGSIPQALLNVLGQINYPQVPTIYGPTLEYSFLLGYLVAPAQVWPLQWLYSLVDLALVALLLRMAEPRWVLLYAWSPLVIKELAFTAHPDVLGVFFLMLALHWRQRQWFAGAATALALSVGAKVFALLFVPFVLWRMPLRYWMLFTLVLAALYVPFLLHSGSELAGLQVFLQHWQFNGSLYPLLGRWLDPIAAKMLLGGILLGFCGILLLRHCRRRDGQLPRGDLLFGVFFLVAPVVNAWYLIWLLPFAVLNPRCWSWAFSFTVLLSYVIGLNFDLPGLDPVRMPLWASLLEYGAVVLAFGLDYWRCYGRRLKTA